MDEKVVTAKVTLTEGELASLRTFASLPTWILQEWYDRYAESNCGPLPTNVVMKLVKQLEGP